jgi:hypothetical protein
MTGNLDDVPTQIVHHARPHREDLVFLFSCLAHVYRRPNTNISGAP